MNAEIVTFAGSSRALREPLGLGPDPIALPEVSGKPAYTQSAALTTAALLWAFGLAAGTQEPQPISPLLFYSRIAGVVEVGETITKATRIRNVFRLLDEWMADTSGYDEETWPKLKKALNEDRLSNRKLFDE